MHRLWYGSSITGGDDWRHLMVHDKLDQQRVFALIDDYIVGDTILMYADSQHAMACRRDQVFEQLEEWLPRGQVKLADPRFQGRVLINYLGVGVGSRLG